MRPNISLESGKARPGLGDSSGSGHPTERTSDRAPGPRAVAVGGLQAGQPGRLISVTQMEIGRGKSGRRAYSLDEIGIVPSRRTRRPEDVSIAWQIDAYRFELPLVTAPMDSVVSPATAITIGKLIGQRIEEIRAAGVTIAARLSPQRTLKYHKAVIDAGTDFVVIRGTTVSAEHVSSQAEPLNLKHFIYELDVPVIVGGCATYTAALHLMR